MVHKRKANRRKSCSGGEHPAAKHGYGKRKFPPGASSQAESTSHFGGVTQPAGSEDSGSVSEELIEDIHKRKDDSWESGSGGQHSTTNHGYGKLKFPRGASSQTESTSHLSGVTQPAGSEAAGGVSEELIEDVLQKVLRDVTAIVARAHPDYSNERRPELNKARKVEMRSKAFGCTLHSLQRAYSKLLHENFEAGWSSELSASVRDLAEAIHWKLSVHSEESTKEPSRPCRSTFEGKRLLEQILEHLQVEFKWEKNISRFSSLQPTLPEVKKKMLTDVLKNVRINCER